MKATENLILIKSLEMTSSLYPIPSEASQLYKKRNFWTEQDPKTISAHDRTKTIIPFSWTSLFEKKRY